MAVPDGSFHGVSWLHLSLPLLGQQRRPGLLAPAQHRAGVRLGRGPLRPLFLGQKAQRRENAR